MQRSVGLIVDCEEVTRAPGMQELVERKIGSQEHGDYVILNLDTGTIPPLHRTLRQQASARAGELNYSQSVCNEDIKPLSINLTKLLQFCSNVLGDII